MHPNLTPHERRHVARIEAMEGMPFADAVQHRYFDERTPAVTLCTEWGLQFRSFRSLLAKHGIDMKSRSQAITETWVGADERRAEDAERMRQTMARHDFTGDRNIAKRPEVRAKISAAKKRDNAAKRPEVREKISRSWKRRIKENPDTLLNRRLGGISYRGTRHEHMLLDALVSAGLPAERGYRINRRRPDIVIEPASLVIECDGAYWHSPETDGPRDEELNNAGWGVLHVPNEAIDEDVHACVAAVIAIIIREQH